MKIFVSGTPKPQPRPKACVRGKHAMMYDCGTADGWKWVVGKAILDTAKQIGWRKSDKAIKLELTFILPRAKNHFHTSKKNFGELKPDAPVWKKSKPDCDNLVKAVMDAITDSNAIWNDDSQVVMLMTSKLYGEQTGCDIVIEELEG